MLTPRRRPDSDSDGIEDDIMEDYHLSAQEAHQVMCDHAIQFKYS